jgi:acyl transferase domain-containing protein/NAD(P)H-dependent flavin oxidoreductase YrpB (nitropropane dioxygenase family)/NAD(P)-dependent dehydrogenase (short-subunit alcohol dehydrogenase family)
MNTGCIVGITPFERPDASLAHALAQAGAVAVLDLGRERETGLEAIEELRRRGVRSFGVRLPEPSLYRPEQLPANVSLVMIDAGPNVDHDPRAWKAKGRAVWLQVCSNAEAKAAAALDPDGLVVKGSESGGRVGTDSSLILLQQVRRLGIPFWVQGGIGPRTAAACIVAGARGVVLDSQLSLLREARTPDDIRKALSHADGIETRVVHGHQTFFTRFGDRSLEENLLPLGQDACFARSIAERHTTTRAFVRSLARSVEGAIRQAKAIPMLTEGSAMARAGGTRFALAQGPMTRVSDRAEFIDAVAENGAMPFLALSLMKAEQCRKTLEETTALLGTKPWGVGILGFVNEELQREQAEVLAGFSPSAVLIAGGRPSQAEPLEKRGIRTFLHVPSPGLLRQFLKEGARRFVFEGRECGGHVGPKTSFVLWENQLEVLLAFEAVHEVEAYFAGGIHDAVTGAMISAMAAPLAARGAKVGALIGTAYLFTNEAVESGAIQEAFQKEAIACESTALLETAPGHSTRCALTPFVRRFEDRKKELKAARVDSKQLWAELERLNVGRLRVASKGVERVGDGLVAVGEKRQREEGLFMLGQVAQLRNEACTMRELHEEICDGAEKILSAFATESKKATAPADIAIVGMACTFPGAPDLGRYWSNILAGKSLIGEVPRSRWNPDTYFEANSSDPGKSISKWGGFLEETDFDPVEYGIPPNSMRSIEPVQLLSLKIAKQALADAGYLERDFDRERTSVIFAAEAGAELASAFGFRAYYPQLLGKMPKELDEFLPTLSEDTFPGVLANVIAGRVANRLDLGGSNYTVDAACGSSLAALDLAMKELSHGESDMVLCGGADLHNSINDYLMFSSVRALSPTGQSKPFSAAANGIVLAEGIAVVVLKRLEDAERDGDRVYAVVKSVGSSSDGKSLGLTAPRKEGQMRALARAYERAGVSPAEIELVEAHGTGTVVGDRTELESLTELFSEAGALNRGCALGSVKSQIGHAKCAAGLAGLIKTALSVHHAIIPPTLHVEEPNPSYHRESSPFYFAPAPKPWTTSRARNASVSAFGFGGTNFHAVLTSHSGSALASPRAWPAELFLFENENELTSLKRVLTRGAALDLSRLARTITKHGRTASIAIVARDVEDLSAKVELALAGRSGKGVFLAGAKRERPGKIAFLFSGQGSQSVGMGAEFFHAFPQLREYLKLGRKWARLVYPSGAADAEAEEALKQTRVTQPALGMLELALARLVRELGIEPDMLAGHSYGELAALAVAGGIAEHELLPLSEARGLAIETASAGVQGAMAAAFADAETVTRAIDGLSVVLANHNAPAQVVLSGDEAEIDRAIERLEKRSIRVQKIPVSCAFHSPLIARAREAFARTLAGVSLSAPSIPVYSNTTGARHSEAELRERLAEQLVEPVRFVREIETMYADGARVFLEIGPGGRLKNLAGQILEGKPHLALNLDRPGGALEQLLLTLGELAVNGFELDTRVLFASRELAPYELPKLEAEVPSATAWRVNGHLARLRAGALPPGSLRPGELTLSLSSVVPGDVQRGVSADGDTRDSLVREYLGSMKQLVESQRQVMLSYLGAEPRAAIADLPRTRSPSAEPTRAAVVAPRQVEAPTALRVPAVVLEIVSRKTGYPEEMLGLDQDLEADLSIDSIKRFEILGEIAERLGFAGRAAQGDDGGIKKLAAVKTLRQLIASLEERITKKVPDATASPASVAPASVAAAPAPRAPEALPVGQFLLRLEDAPDRTEEMRSLKGRSFLMFEDHSGLSTRLNELLTADGANVRAIRSGQPWPGPSTPIDGLLLLSALDPDAPPPLEVFQTLQESARRSIGTVVGVTGTDGLSGLFKSFAKEHVDKTVKIIDVDRDADIERQAQAIFSELRSTDRQVEISYRNGVRQRLKAVPVLNELGAKRLRLDRNSVVLMLGGARGIAARSAIKLAEEYGCRFEVVGRSPLPGAESAETSGIADIQTLRAHFIAKVKGCKPSEIEATCRRLLADREIRETLARLDALGGRTTYHSFDVRDRARLGECIDSLYAKGRIDGVIHAAGVLSDSLLLDKSAESFARVYETKVNAAEVLAEKLRSDVQFVAFFSSVSGCFGNRGQTDYAAANDTLDRMARALDERLDGRAVSFNWGPWAGTGMVSSELEREYRRLGIGLIPPEVGTQRFVDELNFGDPRNSQVVIMSGSPESFV